MQPDGSVTNTVQAVPQPCGADGTQNGRCSKSGITWPKALVLCFPFVILYIERGTAGSCREEAREGVEVPKRPPRKPPLCGPKP
jgi:hypothetical protein